MEISDVMGKPEVHEDHISVKISDAAFICTKCGVEKEDKTSTFCFLKGEVLCDDCLPPGHRKPRMR